MHKFPPHIFQIVDPKCCIFWCSLRIWNFSPQMFVQCRELPHSVHAIRGHIHAFWLRVIYTRSKCEQTCFPVFGVIRMTSPYCTGWLTDRFETVPFLNVRSLLLSVCCWACFVFADSVLLRVGCWKYVIVGSVLLLGICFVENKLPNNEHKLFVFVQSVLLLLLRMCCSWECVFVVDKSVLLSMFRCCWECVVVDSVLWESVVVEGVLLLLRVCCCCWGCGDAVDVESVLLGVLRLMREFLCKHSVQKWITYSVHISELWNSCGQGDADAVNYDAVVQSSSIYI